MVKLHTTPRKLPVGRRREAFRKLVEAQDRGMSVPDSRRAVAARYDLTDTELLAVEEEGVRKNWPPL